MFFNFVFRSTDQIQDVREEETIIRTDPFAPRIARRGDSLKKIMPVLEVNDTRLGLFKDPKLLCSSFVAKPLGFKILAPQDGIHILEPRALEAHTDTDAQ